MTIYRTTFAFQIIKALITLLFTDHTVEFLHWSSSFNVSSTIELSLGAWQSVWLLHKNRKRSNIKSQFDILLGKKTEIWVFRKFTISEIRESCMNLAIEDCICNRLNNRCFIIRFAERMLVAANHCSNARDSYIIKIGEHAVCNMQEKTTLLDVLQAHIKELIRSEMIYIGKCQGWRRCDGFRREWLVKG